MKVIQRLLLAASAAFFISPVSAQWQVENYAVPIGRGVGATGFKFASPGNSGNVLTSNGSAADPSFKPPTGGGACRSPLDFGAVGDGTTDDNAALVNAIAATVTIAPGAGNNHRAKCLYLPGGYNFRSSQSITITMPANSVGPVIFGDGGMNSRITFDAGRNFRLVSTTAMFYGDLRNFTINCNIPDYCVQMATNNSDALNGFVIDNLVVHNPNTTAGSGISFNGLFMSRVLATANCAGSGVGTGVGVQINSATMNTIKVAAGNCNVGLYLTSNTNSVSANLFDAIDLEVNKFGLLIDGTAVQRNTFIGGQFVVGAAGDQGIVSTAGFGNVFYNPVMGGLGVPCSNNQTGLVFHFYGAPIGVCGQTSGGTAWINGHQGFLGPKPTVATCPGGVFATGSTDMAGTITGITSTSCLINFATGFTNTPSCVVVSGQTSVSLAIGASTTQLSVNASALTSVLNYHCSGS